MEQAYFDQEDPLQDVLYSVKYSTSWIAKNDGRLFPHMPLYCEGYPKSKFRGYSHAAASLSLIFALGLLLQETRNCPTGIVVSFFYIFAQLCCYGFSALFHVFTWSPKWEILMQKLDHCGIGILSTGLMLPTCVFLLGEIYGTLLFGTSIILCIVLCTNIFKCRPSLTMQGIVAIWWFMPFWKVLFNVMTTLEFSCMIAVIILKAIGLYIFAKEYPDPFPKTFGFHEVFHVFVCIAGLCIFACNWSIIHRSCNSVWLFLLKVLLTVLTTSYF